MSEHNAKKLRECRKCGYRDKVTAKELKEHADKCGRRTKRGIDPQPEQPPYDVRAERLGRGYFDEVRKTA